MLKLCLTVILLGCVTQINCENLPVFIWGQKTPSFLPSLSQLNGDEFVTLVKSQSDKDTLTVVFVERSLSVEDLSQCKLNTQTCFENLRKVDKTYLTAVEDPVKALESSVGKQNQKSISLSNEGDLSEKVDGAGSEKLLFVYLDQAESKEDFAKHDELMSKLYQSIAAQRENVIAIYTARHPSFEYAKKLIRKVRQAGAEPKQDEAPKPSVLTNARVLVAFSTITIDGSVVDSTKVTLSVNETASEEVKASSIDFNLLTSVTTPTGTVVPYSIGFKLLLSGGTWYAYQMFVNEVRYLSIDPVSAYKGKSFGCGDLHLSNGKKDLRITGFQLQALFVPGPEETLDKFSDFHNDCVGFFSPAIWGALFVVILFVFILSIGLTMMMDIKTMDRFDDPKGKTITVNAQE